MDLLAVPAADLVGTHIIFRTPTGGLQSGVRVFASLCRRDVAPCDTLVGVDVPSPWWRALHVRSLASQILRAVQKWRINKVAVHLAGIELDRPRAQGSTCDGVFQGIQVLPCEPGRGFICEAVRAPAALVDTFTIL
jgi:hypothetical protein